VNILHLDHGREMRGGQLQVIRLLRGLRERGHGVVLLARKGSPLLETAQRERFNADVLSIEALRGLSKTADLVHAHDARSHLFAALLSRKPLVVSRRVVFPVGRGLWSRWKYGRANAFGAVSLAAAEELKKAGVADSKISVIYDGVPLLPESWDKAGPVVIPRFADKRKGSQLALEAVRRASAPELLSRNIQEDLRGASLLVYITESEGLGSAALLAMSAGVPVVASDVGGLKEFVLNGETGVRVQNKVDAIAEAIRAVRENPEFAAKLGTQARAMMTAKFTLERMVTETLELYERVLIATR
jgi:glycosyltransferase involved in cell wall biosynthesis